MSKMQLRYQKICKQVSESLGSLLMDLFEYILNAKKRIIVMIIFINKVTFIKFKCMVMMMMIYIYIYINKVNNNK